MSWGREVIPGVDRRVHGALVRGLVKCLRVGYSLVEDGLGDDLSRRQRTWRVTMLG